MKIKTQTSQRGIASASALNGGGAPTAKPTIENHDDPLDPPPAAAAYLNCTEGWLAKMRVFGIGPEYCKIGRRIRYRRSALVAWATANRHRSTSEYQQAA